MHIHMHINIDIDMSMHMCMHMSMHMHNFWLSGRRIARPSLHQREHPAGRQALLLMPMRVSLLPQV